MLYSLIETAKANGVEPYPAYVSSSPISPWPTPRQKSKPCGNRTSKQTASPPHCLTSEFCPIGGKGAGRSVLCAYVQAQSFNLYRSLPGLEDGGVNGTDNVPHVEDGLEEHPPEARDIPNNRLRQLLLGRTSVNNET